MTTNLLSHDATHLRIALDHIRKTATQSRTQSRRLRWIEQRAIWALEGRPYDNSQFDLPKDSATSAVKAELKATRLRKDLDGALANLAAKDAELTTLRARLAELEQQEPVRLELRDRFGDWSLCTQEVFDQYESYHRGEGQPASEWPVRKLYAAPVPAPSQVAAECVQVPRDALLTYLNNSAPNERAIGPESERLYHQSASELRRALLATSQEQAK